MKRRDLVRHLSQHGCSLLREGGRHSWWHNPSLNRRSAVPRHNEVHRVLAERLEHNEAKPHSISNHGGARVAHATHTSARRGVHGDGDRMHA